MEYSDRALIVRTVTNDDVAAAEAFWSYENPFASGYSVGPRALDESEKFHGHAKRHHGDRPDPEIGRAVAEARALQAATDSAWARVQRLCEVPSPSDKIRDKAAAKGYAEGWTDAAETFEGAIRWLFEPDVEPERHFGVYMAPENADVAERMGAYDVERAMQPDPERRIFRRTRDRFSFLLP